MTRDSETDRDAASVPVAREELVVRREQHSGPTTRVDVVTHEREAVVDEPVTRTRVEIERVPVDRLVDAAPETRREDDVLVVPVVEETLVVERRLRLKEEVRIRHVSEETRHRETVTLREQEAVVSREGDEPDA